MSEKNVSMQVKVAYLELNEEKKIVLRDEFLSATGFDSKGAFYNRLNGDIYFSPLEQNWMVTKLRELLKDEKLEVVFELVKIK